MKQLDRPSPTSCHAIREDLENAWCEGHLREALGKPGSRLRNEPPPAEHVSRHLEGCESCRKVATFIAGVDDLLASGFEQLGEKVEPPGEDRIARMLRESSVDPTASVLRRIRRPLVTMLWLTFFALTLLACSVLGVLAYRAIFPG